MSKEIPFHDLAQADLVVDAIYEGGTAGDVSDDPLGKLVPVGNQGGFRYAGSATGGALRVVVLYTSGADRDWPDALDRETGRPGPARADTTRRENAGTRPRIGGPRLRGLVVNNALGE